VRFGHLQPVADPHRQVERSERGRKREQTAPKQEQGSML
jgi:hypothetical protein